MDQAVLDALVRWPDVPAAYGWLSLSARGEWRLHPLGDAAQGGVGQGISNTQILTFIGRNYDSEQDGAWFFQNGPQRVYLRLDAAPYILRTDLEAGTLVTHNALPVEQLVRWYIDHEGQLYGHTNLGAAKVDDRDLMALAEVLRTPQGLSFFDLLEQHPIEHLNTLAVSLLDPTGRLSALAQPAPLEAIRAENLPHTLKFMTNPMPRLTPAAALPLE